LSIKKLVKFSTPDFDPENEFAYPNVWEREAHPTWSRLVIGSREREIPLMLDLCRNFGGQYYVLYVLLVSQVGRDAGRYACPDPLSYDDLELFLYTFQEFFEQDGRHHVWVASTASQERLIFDQHNFIFAYGDLDRYEKTLEAKGYTRGPVRIAAPHAHHYHSEFIVKEDELFEYWKWVRHPLLAGDTWD